MEALLVDKLKYKSIPVYFSTSSSRKEEGEREEKDESAPSLDSRPVLVTGEGWNGGENEKKQKSN